jgi:hypothetical protein
MADKLKVLDHIAAINSFVPTRLIALFKLYASKLNPISAVTLSFPLHKK